MLSASVAHQHIGTPLIACQSDNVASSEIGCLLCLSGHLSTYALCYYVFMVHGAVWQLI